MKRLFSIILLFGLSWSVPGYAEKTGVVHNSYLNIRSKGSLDAPKIGKRFKGDTFIILREKKDWLNVRFSDGFEGWVAKWLIGTQKTSESDSKTENNASEAILSEGIASQADSANAILPPISTLIASESKESASSKTPPQEVSSQTKTLVKTLAKPKEKKVSKGKDEKQETKKERKTSASDSIIISDDFNENTIAKSPDGKESSSSKVKSSVKGAVVNPQKILSSSKSPEEFYNEAIELFEKRRYSEALEANAEALKQAPQNAEILNNLANCYFKMGKIDEAISQWKKALSISPKSAKICNNLGIANYQLENNDKAIDFYKKAILFEPQFPDSYYNLASVYGFKSNFQDALENYRKYLEFSPNSTMKQLTNERIEYCLKQLSNSSKKKTAESKTSKKK